MKVQHVNGSALVVRWARPEVTYHPPILHFLVSYSWTSHDDSYEEMHLTDAKHKLVRLGGGGALVITEWLLMLNHAHGLVYNTAVPSIWNKTGRIAARTAAMTKTSSLVFVTSIIVAR